MTDAYCSRCAKAMEYDGESWLCRSCGFHDCLPPNPRMTQVEVRGRVRKMRALRSGSCLSRRHGECHVSTCECACHNPKTRRAFASELRREAAQLEHDASQSTDAGVRDEAAERAEELRSRADDWFGGDS